VSTNTRVSQQAWDDAVDAIMARANGGTVTVYDGAQPASPDVPLSGQNPLVTMTLSATTASPSVAGVATINPVGSGVAGASGTAAWFRVYSAGAVAVWDGDVGTSLGDMNFPSTAFVAGTSYGLSSWSFAIPPGQ
jgi:hypothetical protein